MLRGVNGELQANGAAVGVADDVDLAQPERNDEISAVGGIAGNGPGAMYRAAARVAAPVVDDRAVGATVDELVGQRRQLVGGQRGLHEDDGIPRPRIVDCQPDAADLDEPHTGRLAAMVAR